MTRPTVVEVRALNAAAWADFKKHWPMELAYVLIEVGGGFVFGVALGLAALVQVLTVAGST